MEAVNRGGIKDTSANCGTTIEAMVEHGEVRSWFCKAATVNRCCNLGFF